MKLYFLYIAKELGLLHCLVNEYQPPKRSNKIEIAWFGGLEARVAGVISHLL